MQTDRPAFGGGAQASHLDPLFLVATILALISILLLPRRRLVAPFIVLTFLGSLGQLIYVAGVHLFVLRLLIIAGLFRVVVAHKEPNQSRFIGGWTSVDTAYTAWVFFHALAAVVQFRGAAGAIIFQSGFIWDALGGYILLRWIVRDEEDIAFTVRVFAFVTVCLAAVMINEKLRGQNLFGYLGVVSLVSDVREGSIRAKGAFAHAILAGVFGATWVPLFWWLWKSGRAKLLGILGFLGSTAMVLTSSSSTPLLAYLSAFLGLAFWPLRKKMRAFRWGLLSALVALHLVMKAPVWFLIARVDLVAGNSGYHRALLIDQCVRHFWDWWLIGTSTAGWGWDMWDLSNQFVAEADTGGLVTVVFFILVIQRSFNRVGRARKIVEGDPQQEWFMWLIGVTILVSVVSYFGVNYYDHTKIAWCAVLAIMSAATVPVLATEPSPSSETGALKVRPPLVLDSPSIAQHVQRGPSR